MSSNIHHKRIAIIGAGMSGLVVAKEFSKSNEVVIFDKSRGIGGRMTTRRAANYHFDHGAQFFTAKSDVFNAFCQKAQQDGIIDQWHCNVAEITGTKVTRQWEFNHKKPHFIAKPQMNSLCKYIAKDLNVLLGQQIESINFNNAKWSLTTTQDKSFDDFDYLILAIPSAQAMNLIPKDFKYFDVISHSKMSACFTLMLGFNKTLSLDFDAALVKESNLSWISVNSSKPQRPEGFSLVVNSSNSWADEHIEDDLDSIKDKMMTSLNEIIDVDVNTIEYQNIHRWRYANADVRTADASLFDPNFNLGICGDWLISGRVENAFLSGLDLYNNM